MSAYSGGAPPDPLVNGLVYITPHIQPNVNSNYWLRLEMEDGVDGGDVEWHFMALART